MEKFTLKIATDITITPNQDFEDLEEIMVELGDNNIVSCNEINSTGEYWVVNEGNIYCLSDKNQNDLFDGRKTVMSKVGSLIDYIDTSTENDINFLMWYYGTKDPQQAVQNAYSICGWVVTDIDCYQAYLDLGGNSFKFRQNNLSPTDKNINNVVMIEEVINSDELTDSEVVEACSDFGYPLNDIKHWILTKINRDLIAECHFEYTNQL